ncbi:hypothetical protein M9Y10_037009 [Tritrichomonas musculus]|uniref:Sel1 repeat family protein n=1 Tax=Tritrichomonas musculus TaxID=1915356 RepID=A0ABR2GTK7_9EUKA
MLASKNRHKQANFAHGFLLHEGKNIDRNIEEAIHYYKEASSFNNQYAKNNLGIIYKHGYGSIKGKAGNAIVYFEEAIRQKNDYLSMYNLAHIHMYDETIKQDIDLSIDLLIRSSSMFFHSKILLCILLIRKFGLNFEEIERTIEKQSDEKRKLSKEVLKIINKLELFEKHIYKYFYESYRNKDFVYGIDCEAILTSDLEKANIKPLPKYPNAKDISSEFYNGFGRDLL